MRAQAELLAQVNSPVFILGENGSGKELAARLIHKLSVRSGFRFLKLDCATLQGDGLEHELFGVVNGRSKPGKLELCYRGTLLLNAIAAGAHASSRARPQQLALRFAQSR